MFGVPIRESDEKAVAKQAQERLEQQTINFETWRCDLSRPIGVANTWTGWTNIVKKYEEKVQIRNGICGPIFGILVRLPTKDGQC